jgi:hypothetical protein
MRLRLFQSEGRSSFLKKRTKKLFPLEPSRPPVANTNPGDVFAFFQKRRAAFPSPPNIQAAAWITTGSAGKSKWQADC